MIWLMTAVLSGLAYWNYRIAHGDFMHPAVVYTSAFAMLSAIDCIANWAIGIDLSSMHTFAVIVLGSAIFTAVHKLCLVSQVRGEKTTAVGEVFPSLRVNNYLALLALAIEAASIYANYSYINAVAAAAGVGSDFFENVVYYKALMTFSDADDLLVKRTLFQSVINIGASPVFYISAYVFFRQWILCRRVEWLWLVGVIVYGVGSLIGGDRSSFFQLVTGMMFFWYFNTKRKQGWFSSNRPLFRKLGIIFGLLGFFFIAFIYLIGRTEDNFKLEDGIQGLWIYTGATIFNLDLYLDNPWEPPHGLFGEYTFARLIPWLGGKLGIHNWIFPLDLPFMEWHGIGLGNVFTTYYAYYGDWGYVGVVLCTMFMAGFCCWIYRLARRADIGSEQISFVLIVNAFICNSVLMSGFSTRFYETVFNIGFVYFLIALGVMVYFVNHVKLGIHLIFGRFRGLTDMKEESIMTQNRTEQNRTEQNRTEQK